MPVAVELSPAAAREVDEAFAWYLERSVSAAEAFVRELDHALRLIGDAPTVWPSFEGETRRYVLRRFPIRSSTDRPRTVCWW